MHIKQGLPDPTTDESLHLVYRGLHRCQSTPERKRLPITIDILKNLNSQLCLSNYTVDGNVCYGHHLLYLFTDSSMQVNTYS